MSAARTATAAANQRTALRLDAPDGPPLLCSLWNLCPQDSLVSPTGSGLALLTVHADRELEDLAEGLRFHQKAAGGILSGADAKAKIDAGASLVQVYSGLVYRGPGLVTEVAQALG